MTCPFVQVVFLTPYRVIILIMYDYHERERVAYPCHDTQLWRGIKRLSRGLSRPFFRSGYRRQEMSSLSVKKRVCL